MEFKNLAEVTKLEEVPEGASVLAATAEGEVVRVPGDGLGGGGADWNAGEGEPGYIANKPDISGGSDVGVLTASFSVDNRGTYSVDKTFSEIEAAYSGGEFVRGLMVLPNPPATYIEVPIDQVVTGSFAKFETAMYSNSKLSVLILQVNADNSVSFDELNFNMPQ